VLRQHPTRFGNDCRDPIGEVVGGLVLVLRSPKRISTSAGINRLVRNTRLCTSTRSREPADAAGLIVVHNAGLCRRRQVSFVNFHEKSAIVLHENALSPAPGLL
jgi:hypothetical protein